MASAVNVTVDVKVSIPDETVCRCLRVLEMWMDDNPERNLVVHRERYDDGSYHHSIEIEKCTAKIWERQTGGDSGIT